VTVKQANKQTNNLFQPIHSRPSDLPTVFSHAPTPPTSATYVLHSFNRYVYIVKAASLRSLSLVVKQATSDAGYCRPGSAEIITASPYELKFEK